VERKTISIMKACELVGVSRRTIYNWLASGKIEYVRTAGGSVRIFVDTLWRDPHRSDRPAAGAVWQQAERNQA
jgi:excisionase family DNA binding protein